MPTPPEEPATRDQLPRSLFPVKQVPLSRYNPEEIERLLKQPHRILPLPSGIDEKTAKLCENFHWRKGISQESRRKVLGNMPRRVKNDMRTELVPIPPGMTEPMIPAINPSRTPLEKTFYGKMKKRVLSVEEYDLFQKMWVSILTEHPEYDNQSDHIDVLAICQESVNMFRIELWEHNNPGRSRADLYKSASDRLDRARRNLSDRRVDRIGSKANTTHTNIAILAGAVDPLKQAKRVEQIKIEESEEMIFIQNTSQFVEQTVMNKENLIVEEDR